MTGPSGQETVVLELASEDDTERLGRALARSSGPGRVIGLIGTLGAGKTRLSRAVAVGLGVHPDSVSSPTYVLIQEYEGRLPVYHFDAYRLDPSSAFGDLGPGDYWDAGGVCLVEWADLVREWLPPDAWFVTLEPTGPAARRATLRGSGVAAVARAFAAATNVFDEGAAGS